MMLSDESTDDDEGDWAGFKEHIKKNMSKEQQDNIMREKRAWKNVILGRKPKTGWAGPTSAKFIGPVG